MGYNSKMIKKIFLFLKPKDKNESHRYLSEKNGIFQHNYLKSYNKEIECFICGKPPNKHIIPKNSKRISIFNPL